MITKSIRRILLLIVTLCIISTVAISSSINSVPGYQEIQYPEAAEALLTLGMWPVAIMFMALGVIVALEGIDIVLEVANKDG